MKGFIFGGDTPWTYEQLQRQRELANRLAAKGGSPKTFGDGLAAIGDALLYRSINKRADARDAELRGEFSDQWGDLFGGGMGGGMEAPGYSQPSIYQPEPADPNSADGIAAGAMDALGKDQSDVVKAGLMARGLPEHVADGFVMNFKDESGLNPGINEANPIVPGSRGGFGLAQWTGPRRKALEAFAQERGKPVSDLETQLDFLVTELQGPESKAAQAILSTQDSGSAAAAVLNQFLRPAEEHRARREAQYTGGQPVRTAQAGGMDMQTIAGLMSNPYASPGQKAVLQALLQQQMQANDPMRQMQLEKGRLELEQMRNPTPKQTSDMQEYEFARSQGFDGSFLDYQTAKRKAGASSVTVTNNAGAPVKPLGTEGQVLVPDENAPSGYRVEVAEGSKLAEERKGAEVMKKEQIAKADDAINLIDDVLTDENLPSVLGRVQGRLDPDGLSGLVMSQTQLDLVPKVQQIQGKAFMDAFESLKGGGQITEREGQAALNAAARLQRYQSPEAFSEALQELRSTLERAKLRANGFDVPEFGDPSQFDDTSQGFPDVSGMDASQIQDLMAEKPVSEWTDEQRAAVAARLRQIRGQ